MTWMKRLAVSAMLACAGCGTGTNGVVPAGENLYMVGGLGHFTDYSGSVVKARFVEEAEQYCRGRGKQMVLVNSTAHDSGYGVYASAEVQFRCVAPPPSK